MQQQKIGVTGLKQPKKLPSAAFSRGAIKATIWQEEKGYSISLVKSYKSKETQEWKKTTTYFLQDIPKVQYVLRKAEDWICGDEEQHEE